MQFRFGNTRLVLLIGRYAVKVPHFGILAAPVHLGRMLMPGNAAWRRVKLQRYGANHSLVLGIYRYVICMLTCGVSANRQEAHLSRAFPQLPLAQVIASYCGGLVLVMERGTPVPSSTSLSLRSSYRPGSDLDQAKHVCSVRGKLCFIDYGHPDVPSILGIGTIRALA